MAHYITLPKVGLTMIEGTLVEWFKKEGDEVKKGEPLYSVETDKTAVEVEALESGTLIKIVAPVGTVVPVGGNIAAMAAPGESPQLDDQKKEMTQKEKTTSNVNTFVSGRPVVLPKVGLTMVEGTINAWFKKEKDEVKKGEPLYSVETDKTDVEVEALDSGILAKIVVPVGEVVPVGTTIAIMVDPGQTLDESGKNQNASFEAETSTAQNAERHGQRSISFNTQTLDGRIKASMRAKKIAREHELSLKDYLESGSKGTGPEGRIVAKDIEQYLTSHAVRATPMATILAKEHHLELSTIAHNGNRVVAQDVMRATAPEVSVVFPEKQNSQQEVTNGDRMEHMAGMRKVICRNMMLSLSSMAQANHKIKVDMQAAIEWRTKYKERNIRVSFNDIVVRCCVQALKDMPIMNSSVDGDNIVYHKDINVGIAVSVDNGLIVPVLHNADQMGVQKTAETSTTLIEKARSNKLSFDDYHGGTFTVSSLGMFDIDSFTAIINPPEVGILAVGKIEKMPVVRDDEIVIRPMCTLCLTYDHRIIDGSVAAQFLQKIKCYLQDPWMLL